MEQARQLPVLTSTTSPHPLVLAHSLSVWKVWSDSYINVSKTPTRGGELCKSRRILLAVLAGNSCFSLTDQSPTSDGVIGSGLRSGG